MLASLKIYLGIGASDTSKDALLNQILSDCALIFEDLTHNVFDDDDDGMCSVVVQLAIIEYNRIGLQGLSSTSFSGQSESYIDGLPSALKSRVCRYRKVQVIESN